MNVHCTSWKGCHIGTEKGNTGLCFQSGTYEHEIGHLLGLIHEQNRSDRDEYLVIYWENIESGEESQFDKVLSSEDSRTDQYDYGSTMQYEPKVSLQCILMAETLVNRIFGTLREHEGIRERACLAYIHNNHDLSYSMACFVKVCDGTVIAVN
jgi:hypothetical protein